LSSLGGLTVERSDGSTRGPRVVVHHWAAIVATPFLLLAINPNLFINVNTNVWVDAWVNTGFFLSLPDHLSRWGHTYYATRLSWLLPGYAAHQIFSPLAANYIIHFGFFYLLLAAVYCLISAGVNRTTAFIVTLLVGGNPQVLASLSWDYVDGAVITYFTAALLFLEKASAGATNRERWAVAAGAALACMVSANLVAATLVPICCLFVWLRVPDARSSKTWVIMLIAAAGSAATLAVLGSANRLLGGRWLFLTPSLRFATNSMWSPSPYDVEGSSWLAEGQHLVLLAVACVAAFLALTSRPRGLQSFSAAIQLTFLVAAAWWVVHSTLWTHSIHVFYYTSYLVPLGIIALALVPDSPLATLTTLQSRHVRAWELAIAGLAIAAHLLVLRSGDLVAGVSKALGVTSPDLYRLNAIAACVVGSAALVSLRFIRWQWLQWPAYLLALWIGYSTVPMSWAAADTPGLKDDYALTVSVHRYIGEHLEKRRLAMWYALPPGERRPFRNIASTYLWGWMLVNENLPTLSEREAALLIPDTQLVLLVADAGDADVVKGVVQKLDFDFTVRAQKQFGPTDAAFWVVIGELTRLRKADH
jgi:hypothetical protein